MFTGTYSLTDARTTLATGQADVAITEVPLPSTAAGGLVLVGVAGGFAISRRAPRAAA